MSRADQIPMTFSQTLNIDRCSHRPPQLAPPFLLKHVWNAHLGVYWSRLKPTCIIWVDNSHWAPEVCSISIHFQNHKWSPSIGITIHWPFQWHQYTALLQGLDLEGRLLRHWGVERHLLPVDGGTPLRLWRRGDVHVDLRGSSRTATPRGCHLGMLSWNATVSNRLRPTST